MKIPRAARYRKVMRDVGAFCRQEVISEFPVDVFSIIKRNKWGLMTYNEYAAMRGIPIEDILNFVPSEDGFTMFDGTRYAIAYNDSIYPFSRIRFTLMHEIGHIYLGHFTDFEEPIFSRGGLSDPAYTVLEYEANCFARNVLAPAPIVQSVSSNRNTVFLLEWIFDLSHRASEVRAESLNWDLKYPLAFLTQQASGFINRILHGKACTQCGHYFVSSSANYCPICGHDELYFSSKRSAGDMIYDGIELNKNGFPLTCPQCENEEINGQHCKICGVFLVNKCTNVSVDFDGDVIWECGEIADGNARYCIKCGHKTSYLENGLLRPWKVVKKEKEELDEMLDIPF